MSALLEEQYFSWLVGQVATQRVRHWTLLRQLHHKEYVWIILNDDNRLEDGRYLRYQFLEEYGLSNEADWRQLGCSFLEMLIGLSRRLSFEAEGEPREWFWHLLRNLDLEDFTDDNYIEEHVDEVMETVIWRRYLPDGTGGLFPLRYADEDQRNVEIWYQMGAYILENNL